MAGPPGRRPKAALARALEVTELRPSYPAGRLSRPAAGHKCLLLAGRARSIETCAGLGGAGAAGLRLAFGAGEIPARLACCGTLFSDRLCAEYSAEAMV